MSAVSLLCNSVEDLRVHVSELKQQAERDRAAVARAHKDKVSHTHTLVTTEGSTFIVVPSAVHRPWS